MIAPSPQRRQLRHSEVEAIRHAGNRSMLLFVTDRCPVGCKHCSVDSRPDSPTIRDFNLFEGIVDWLCGKPELDVVGISGGEPFVERQGLSLASRKFYAVGKQQVIFTSGIWASCETPEWIRETLTRSSCVYLSTDAFHFPAVDDNRFERALRAIADAGAWIVVQVVDHGDAVARADRSLHRVFGAAVNDYAEINRTHPLTNGRGAGVFTRRAETPGHAFGPCPLATSPIIRYDGRVTGCCNESVIMNQGPARLRRNAGSVGEIQTAVETFRADPLLRVIGGAGLGFLTQHPRFADLAEQWFATNCDLCWKLLDRVERDSQPDHLLNAMLALGVSEDSE